MLTTMRRVTAVSAVRAPSAAALGFARSTAAPIAARIPFVCFVLMPSSVLGTTGATAQPSHKHFIYFTLRDSPPRDSVSAGARRVQTDTARALECIAQLIPEGTSIDAAPRTSMQAPS